MNEIIIRESKSESLMLSILSIIMVMASIFVLVTGFYEVNGIYISIGILGSVFFGICAISIVKRTIKTMNSKNTQPLLIINNEGISDTSTMTSVGFVPWEEIKSVKIVTIVSQKYIGIEVNDIDNLMSRISFAKKLAIKSNSIIKYPPIIISLNSSELKIDKVFSIINERLEEYNENIIRI